jgi:anti-sigma B factor antagonist
MADLIPKHLDLATEITPGETIVHGSGTLWFDTAPLLRMTVEPLLEKNKIVVIDLENVGHLDSTGLGTLRQLYDSATAANCQFKIANLNQRLKKLFSITRLDEAMASALGPDQLETS